MNRDLGNNELVQVKLLPLRGLVVFPSVSMHMDVGREKSILALEKAMDQEQLIFLVNQIEHSVSEPTIEDIYEIGTLAKIKQILKLPNGSVRILVEGISRARLVNFIDNGEYLEANVEEINDVYENDSEIIAMTRLLKDNFEKFLEFYNKISKDESKRILNLTDVVVLTDQIISVMPIILEMQQKLLEMTSVKERIYELNRILQMEYDIYLLKNKIETDVKSSIEQSQKDFFLREQIRVIQKELGGMDGRSNEIVELEEKIRNTGMPEAVCEKMLKELERYELVPQSSPESTVIRTYLGWMTDLPWTKQTESLIDIQHVQKSLDADHYGLEKVKERIVEYLAVQKITNSLKSPILCFVGPPGVGKTSLAKSIAAAINRKFVRVSLGGMRDEAEIRGHRRTYIGAMPGRIIQSLKKAESKNPVFLLDEIDKMSSDFRGDPASAMLEVLDPEQNHTFTDHYIEEAFDLSKVMFIATANSLATISAPLRDRMEIIELSSYTEIEKLQIAKKHLVPKQLKEHGLSKRQLVLKDDAILGIIRHYTREAGVRNLERTIGTVCRKITKQIVDESIEKATIKEKDLVKLLSKPIFDFHKSEKKDLVGVATGLAYTSFGGDTLQIEVSISKGKGKLMLTGKLGDVMKESAQTAYSYVRSNAKKLRIDEDFYEKLDIHIHVPEGAVPKDGPSAGITITTALVSALTNKPINKLIGMTGEVTLRGRVLPIGGLKEKSLSAHRAGLKTVICPKQNERDLEEIPESIKKDMDFVLVSDVSEVLKLALI